LKKLCCYVLCVLLLLIGPQTINVQSVFGQSASQDARNAGKVSVWYSSEDGSNHLTPQQDGQFTDGISERGIRTLSVDDSQTFQSYLGVGSSLEESTIYNLMQLSDEKREKVLKFLMDPKSGLGWNVIRITFGTSDFTSREWYSYNDHPPGGSDVEMKHFSIQKDMDYHIIPIIQEALKFNPNAKIIASAWSPPGWMKESGKMDGGVDKTGKMKDEYLPALALYYRKAIESYAEHGIPIYAMSLINEPNIQVDYPMTQMTVAQQTELVKLMKKEFQSNINGGILNTQLWVNEFNIFDWEKNKVIYDDPEAYAAADGTSFHDYYGELTGMSEAHKAHPDKPIYLTERSVWGTKGADRIIQYFRNYSQTYVAWVTMLDNHGKPNVSSTGAGRTLLTLDAEKKDHVTLNFEAYLMAQFSKFIQQGAVRIESNHFDAAYDQLQAGMTSDSISPAISNVAFKNPDGSMVMVVTNTSATAKDFRIIWNGAEFNTTLPSKTVATYKWTPWAKGALKDIVASPVVSLGSGKYVDEVKVAISTKVKGAVIRYTLDGKNPSATSPVYKSPLTLKQTDTVLKAAVFVADKSSPFISPRYEFVQSKLLPGKFEAADYMDTNDGQTEKSSEGGLNVGYIDKGDWMDYPIEISKSGSYKFVYRIATSGGKGTIDAQINSKTIAQTAVKNSGGWQVWGNIVSEPVVLEKGKQTLRLYMNGSSFNLKSIQVVHEADQVGGLLQDPEDVKTVPITGNQIRNGEFTKDSTDWTLWQSKGNTDGANGEAKFDVVAGEMKIKVVNEGDWGGSDGWEIQIKQGNLQLVQGKTYVVKFQAKSTAARTIQVAVEGSNNSDGSQDYSGKRNIELRPATTEHTIEFKMLNTTDAAAQLNFLMGHVGTKLNASHEITVDNVSITLKEN
jgi:glucosylceramidase